MRQGPRRVVVTGIGAVTPIGTGREGLWRGLRSRQSAVGPITRFDASALGGGNPLAFTQDIAIRQHANETTLSRQGAHGHGWIAGISITAAAIAKAVALASFSERKCRRRRFMRSRGCGCLCG